MQALKTKNIIYIPAAGIEKNKSGQWFSSMLNTAASFSGSPGGYTRIWAGKYLYDNDPKNTILIVAGGHGGDKNVQREKHPGLAQIMERELIDIGVPAKSIIKEKKSNKTFDQLYYLGKFIQKNQIKKISITSNDYHLPRIKNMLKYVPELRQLFNSVNIKFISTEQTCLKYQPKKWKPKIIRAYNSQAMKVRIKLEQKGVNDLKIGKYKYNKSLVTP